MRTTSSNKSTLDALFGKSKQAILGLFFGNPGTEYHLREVARRAGMSIGAVNRDLTSLVQAGILSSEKRGNQLFFRADRDCTIFDELHGIAIKTIGLADRFREALVPLSSKVKIAYIYGSIARGEERAESDIDVMVIGEVKAFEVVKALASVHKLFKREINRLSSRRQSTSKNSRIKTTFYRRSCRSKRSS